MSSAQILVVDDDPDVRELVGTILGREGAQVSLAGDGQHALALLKQRTFQVLFTDLCMPGVDGLAILRRVPQVCPKLSAVVFTGHAQLDSCIEAMRLGACDYVMKPFTPQAIRSALTRAMQTSRAKEGALATGGSSPAGNTAPMDDPIAAASAAMRVVRDLANVVARAMNIAAGCEIGRKAMAPVLPNGSCGLEMISVPVTGSLREIEQHILAAVIQRCRGNKAAAARALGLHRRTLYRMLEEEAGDGAPHAPRKTRLST